jgi:5-methylcytosine-specific restriction endonuclease McrA
MNFYSTARRQIHPPKLDPVKRKARTDRWLAKNKDWQIAYHREWYHTKLDKKKRNQYLRDSGKGVMYTNKRRAIKAGLTEHHTQEEWNLLVERCGSKCLACKKVRKMTPDHVIPLSLGGADTIDNIQPLCRSCNCSKGSKMTDYRANDVCEIPQR